VAGKFKIVLTTRAEIELDNILKYHLSNYGEGAARRIYEAINQKFEAIQFMPSAYTLYAPINREFKRQYRYVIAKKSYRLLYTIIVEKSIIRVVTIRHVKSDPGYLINTIEEE